MTKFGNKQNEFINKHNIGNRGFWVSRSCAVVGIVICKIDKNYYVLINKRGNSMSHSGKYNLCCGYLDWNESGSQALVREVFEETGVNINYIKNHFKLIYNFTKEPKYINTNPSDNAQNISLTYGLIFESDRLLNTTSEHCEEGEVDDIKWLNIKYLENIDFAFNHDKKVKKFLIDCNINQ